MGGQVGKQGDFQKSVPKDEFFINKTLDCPGAGDCGGEAIGEQHFVVFKQFGIDRGEDQRDQGHEEIEGIFDDGVEESDHAGVILTSFR